MANGDDPSAELDLDTLDMTAMTPQRFARIVREAPPGRTAEVMAGPHRRRILDELFGPI